MNRHAAHTVRWVLILVAAGLACAHAGALRWVSDDAFITFRYVDNWLDGLGIVYNAGERVEGYTHPLWMLLLTGLRATGLELVLSSQILSIVSFALGVVVYGMLGTGMLGTRWPGASPTRTNLILAAPVTSLILAANYDVAVWGTGGLETALFLAEIGVTLWLLTSHPESTSLRRPAMLGLLSALLVLTRPDGVLVAVTVFAFLIVWERQERSWKRAITVGLVYGVPVLLIFAPYLVWKLWYYGDILPNTYYAKSGGSAWFEQGIRYVGLYLQGHPSTAVFLFPAVVVPASLVRRRDPESRLITASTILVLVYLLFFVIRVGGDFMYARFLVPILPPAFLSFELLAKRWLRGADGATVNRASLVVAVVLVLLPVSAWSETRFRHQIFQGENWPNTPDRPHGIADERWHWSHHRQGESPIEMHERIGGILDEYFDGLSVRVSIRGQASLGYFGRFSYVLEEYGLTDPGIARLERGLTRVGHEKRATPEYLREKDIHFRFFVDRPEVPYRLAYFRVGEKTTYAHMLHYDADLVEELRRRHPQQIGIVRFPEYFDLWCEKGQASLSDAEFTEAVQDFEVFYFAKNEAPVRREKLSQLMAARSIP